MPSVMELVIGLILIFFLLSLLVSAINEAVEGVLKRRGKYLLAAIQRLVGSDLQERLFRHSLIRGLSDYAGKVKEAKEGARPKKRVPSYIPAPTFVDALVGTLTAGTTFNSAESLLGALDQQLAGIEDEDLRTVFRQFLSEVTVDKKDASASLEEFKEKLEDWYNAAMDRVSGWYKRNTRWLLLIWGTAVVLTLNADSFLIARTLWNDETLRASVVAEAEKLTQEGSAPIPCPTPTEESDSFVADPFECVADRVNQIEALEIPLGWPAWPWEWSERETDPRIPHDYWEALLKLSGLALTASALTLGADFWFNLLNKVVNLRATGRPPLRPDETT